MEPRQSFDRRTALAALAIVLLALGVRVTGLNWDQGHSFHPDERAITYAVQRLSFHPLQLNPGFFAYGSLPLYVIRAVTGLAGLFQPHLATNYDFVILAGRAVSAVAGTLTVLVTILLGRRLWGPSVGLLGGFLLALCVLHIQHSHFMTTDIFLTLMITTTLYHAVGVVRFGRRRDFFWTAVFAGFALATKASAAPVLLPVGLAALVRAARERRPAPLVRGALLVPIVTAAAFFAGEPYAVFDFSTFWRHVTEQGRMVRNAGSLPYTNQYIGTPKYLYEIEQIVFWCMGPFLGIAALWGTGRAVLRLFREQSGEQLVLLAWAVPYFLITGWFEVKFVRYLLPIYPLMVLWGAAYLVESSRRGRMGRALAWAVGAGTVLTALAFLSIYQREHTVVTASRWVYRNVPAGAKILTQHWDEGFPMPLPGGGRPQRYQIVPLPYYEPDNPAKIRRLARELATGDYVAFQTKRLYGAVTMAPDKYPLTNNLFYLLFAGDLGYELVYEHASRPGLFGIEFPDELADESFTVYDHPKVLIFRNRDRLDEGEIFRRVMSGVPSVRLSRRDLLLAGTGAKGIAGSAAEPVRSGFLALAWWALALELLALAAFGRLRRVLPGPGGYALSKVLGVLLFAWISWLAVSLGAAPLGRPVLFATAALLAVVGLPALRRKNEEPGAADWPALTEVVFWGTLALFLAIRAWNPEIYWGEKPMDFSFLNALYRTSALPPPEPWFAGSPLHYTYFGHYVVAALGRLCNIHPGLTFNLGIATFGALTAAAAFGAGAALSRRRAVALLAVLFVVLAGNLSGPLEYARRGVVNFDYFWATSRVIRHTINEYPFWSFLFADLHAHVLALPFSLTFVALTLRWVRRGPSAGRLPLAFLMALALGAVWVTNGWSTPTYTTLLPVLLVAGLVGEPPAPLLKALGRFLVRVILPWAAVVLLAWALFFPFFRAYHPPELSWGWERDAFVNGRDYALIFGVFLFAALPFLFAAWARVLGSATGGGLRIWQRTVIACVALTAFAAFVLTIPELQRFLPPLPLWARSTLGAQGYGSVRLALAILGLLGFALTLERKLSSEARLVAALFGFALVVTAGCDVVHVWDRMNTIFKFYLDAWLLFGLASAGATVLLLKELLRRPLSRAAWVIGLLALLGASAFTAVTATQGLLRTNRVRTPKPTLDGTAYLALRNPHEAAAIEWLNQNIAGIPVLVEAWGPSYQDYARISMNTGLPIVIGWEYHVLQRAHSRGAIERRKHDVKLLYTTANKSIASAVLRRYHVSLVYVGALERRTYAGANLRRFQEWDDLLTPVYQNEGVTIFGVNGQLTAMPRTTIEQIPLEEEEAPGAPAPPGLLSQPRGVGVDSKGFVYVADFDHHRVQKYTPDLEIAGGWGGPGDLPGQFRQPCEVDVDRQDRVFVADTWNQRVQIFDTEGEYIGELGGPWYGPRGVAVHGDDVFVADTGNHRIRRLTRQGKEVRTWGGRGTAPGQFQDPIGVETDADGNVYVTDNGNGRLQIFDRDGRLLGYFPVPGWRSEVFSEPKVTITPDGTIWVTVPLEKEVRGYTRDGKLVRVYRPQSIPAARFSTPLGIAYNAVTNQLIVTDLDNRVVALPLPEDGPQGN